MSFKSLFLTFAFLGATVSAEAAQTPLFHTHAREISCVAARAVALDAKAIGNGYSNRPYKYGIPTFGTSRRPKQFCQPLNIGRMLNLDGEKLVLFKNRQVEFPEINAFNFCGTEDTGYQKMRDFIMRTTHQIGVYELYSKALELTNNDMVEAINLVGLFTENETLHNDRAGGPQAPREKNPILRRLRGLDSRPNGDFYGQFYHWYGYLGLVYLYRFSPPEYAIVTGGEFAYEAATRDVGDLKTDSNAIQGGQIFACALDYLRLKGYKDAEDSMSCKAFIKEDNQSIEINTKFLPRPTTSDIARMPGCIAILKAYNAFN